MDVSYKSEEWQEIKEGIFDVYESFTRTNEND